MKISFIANKELQLKLIIFTSFLAYSFVFYFLSSTQGYIEGGLQNSLRNLRFISLEQKDFLTEVQFKNTSIDLGELVKLQESSDKTINQTYDKLSEQTGYLNYTYLLITILSYILVLRSNISKKIKTTFYCYFAFLSLIFFIIPRIT